MLVKFNSFFRNFFIIYVVDSKFKIFDKTHPLDYFFNCSNKLEDAVKASLFCSWMAAKTSER